MKEEKDIFNQFRDKDKTSEVRPSAQAWDKLSSKLDAYQQKKEATVKPLYKRIRIWTIAAAIALLVGLANIIIPMSKNVNEPQAASIDLPVQIEDLEYSKPSGFYALAIKTNKYYNTSPTSIAQKENEFKRLQITERKTRKAEQPSFLAKTTPPVKKSTTTSNGVLKNRYENDQVLTNASGAASPGNNTINTTSIEEESFAAGMESDVDLMEEAAVLDEVVVKEWEAERQDASTAAAAPARAKSKDAAKKRAAETVYADEINASSNVITYDSNEIPSANIDHFKWLIGDWKTKNDNGQMNFQNWKQKDEFTLTGKAILSINDESINVEKLVIKKIGDQLYFLRVNDLDGNTLTYQLKSMKNNEAVFTNFEFGDEIRFKQHSENKFKNGFISNGSLQLNQYPGNVKGLVEYKRVID